jgi:hypothetical protein
MPHQCNAECECTEDLTAAAAALSEASKLLSASTTCGSDEVIEAYYAAFRRAKARFSGAMAAYRDHLAESRGLAA